MLRGGRSDSHESQARLAVPRLGLSDMKDRGETASGRERNEHDPPGTG
jgi:hypothetical protein